MSYKKTKSYSIAKRRKEISELLLKGYAQAEVASKLNIAQSTVSEESKKIMVAWRQSTIRDFDAARGMEVAKLERIERESWAGYERSQQPFQSATTEGEQGMQKAKRTIRHQNGDPRFLAIILQCQERRAKLLGLDAPVQVAPLLGEPIPLTREDRDELMEAIFQEKGLRKISSKTIEGK